eukprot:c11786_g1_i2.p1 GENE.c11786_g1_i2~~c11786_g1_i2.p1  ORF type:complete len:303 (+),score=80.92 c11786_g1_i2:460-1368(+)
MLRCDLKNPDTTFWIITQIGLAPEFTEIDPPSYYYFGRQVVEGRRDIENEITLKKRGYLGTTSTDAQLTLLYANQANVGPGSFVWDPCCGTASILVGCAYMGAHCFGSDLDYKVIQGKGGNQTIAANFTQYKMANKLLGVSLMDLCQHAIRPSFKFDAIVTDPPYGVREGSRKVHPNEESEVSLQFREMGRHATQMEKHAVGFVLMRLMEVSAEMLRLGGRLVFLFPSVAGYQDEQLPAHPCFKLISNSEQKLTLRWSRRLITMEKITEPTSEMSATVNTSYDVRDSLFPNQSKSKPSRDQS